MIITFCGHAQVSNEPRLKERLRDLLWELCENHAVEFYLGGYGNFDTIACSVCAELRREMPQTKLFFISPYFSTSRQDPYDGTIYPDIECVPLKFAISARNKWMIEHTEIVVAYVEHAFGGAYQTLRYSQRKNKKIINLGALL